MCTAGFKLCERSHKHETMTKQSASRCKQCLCPRHAIRWLLLPPGPRHLRMVLPHLLAHPGLGADSARDASTDKGAFSIVLNLQQSKQDNPPAAK